MLRYPASIDWEVTPFCNQNCIHCYNCWRSIEDKRKDVEFNNYVNAEWYMRVARIIAKNKPVSVIITGGEPLSVFWKIDKAIEYLISEGIYVSMNTNLTMLDDCMAERIRILGIHIFTSIPSAIPEICDKVTKTKGSFEKIDHGIKKCLEYNIPVATNMVVTKINHPSIAITAEYIKNLGFDYFCCTKAAFPANALPELREEILSHKEFREILTKLIFLGEELDINVDSAWAYSLCGLENKHIPHFGLKRRCGAGRFNFAITYNGDIKACNVDTVIYGNILNDDFKIVMSRMISWQTDEYMPEECKKCKSLYLCGGGCRLEAENTFGDKHHLDSTADIDNINRLVDIPGDDFLDKNAILELNDQVVFVEEEGCVRMSRRSIYEYVTQECRKFFESHSEFNIQEFRDELELDHQIAEIELIELIKKELIVLKGGI